MAIKIEMLRCFSTVAESGSLSEAATRLGRSPSALSMTLKQLEDHLGQPLFVGERKNRLTPLGQDVFELAQGQLRHFDETVRAIETSADAPKGLVRIVSVPSVAGLVFPSVIRTFVGRHPGLKVDLRDTDSQAVIDALLHGRADLGIASGRQVLNGIRQTPLFADRFGLICAPGHPLARRSSAPTIREVAAANFVSNKLCDLIETAAFRQVTEAARVSVHNTLSLGAMVRAGDWVTVLPRTVVHILRSDLVFRPLSDLPDRRQVCLYLRQRSPFLEFSEELAELVRQFDWARLA